MALTYIRCELHFPANPTNATSNAGRVPYLKSGNSVAQGFRSALTFAVGNAPADTYIELPVAGDDRYISFNCDVNSVNLQQGFLNKVGAGTQAGPMMGVIEVQSGITKKLFIVKAGHIYLNQSAAQLYCDLWVSAPRFA